MPTKRIFKKNLTLDKAGNGTIYGIGEIIDISAYEYVRIYFTSGLDEDAAYHINVELSSCYNGGVENTIDGFILRGRGMYTSLYRLVGTGIQISGYVNENAPDVSANVFLSVYIYAWTAQ